MATSVGSPERIARIQGETSIIAGALAQAKEALDRLDGVLYTARWTDDASDLEDAYKGIGRNLDPLEDLIGVIADLRNQVKGL